MTAKSVDDRERIGVRLERHFGDRVVSCLTQTWPGIGAMFVDNALRNGAQEALVCGTRRVSWSELEARVLSLAGGLAERNVGPGDRVVLLLENDIEFAVASFAVIVLGAILVPVNVREQTPGLTHIVRNSGAVALMYDSALAGRLPAAASTPGLRLRIHVGAAGAGESLEAVMQASPVPNAAPVAEEDVAMIMYTSGTTGLPKGAMVTHLNVVHSVLHYQQAFKFGRGERGCVTVPLSHITGFVALMMTMVGTGGTLLIDRQFKARDFLAFAERERMTYTLMVPAMYNLCLLEPEFADRDLGSWRVGAYGGSPMPPSAIDTLARVLPGLGLYNVYGSTETASPTVIMPAELTRDHQDSVGLPLTCTEVTVMDEQGREQQRGEIGELWLKGPNVVASYWDNPQASLENFCAGYWRSGDIGRVDDAGFVYVMDRIKDLINRGGYKIYSAEVENAVAEHPAVVEVAAVAKPCPVLNERVHVFITARKGVQLDLTEIRAFCAQRLSDYKVPESCTVGWKPLPRNASGKILKRDLRERLRSDR